MKANNLTICIPAECNKNCPYCVSKMTFEPIYDIVTFNRNLRKAQKIASLASVSSVLLTSKGEPMLNMEVVKRVSMWFRQFPLEIQTNGTLLNSDTINNLYDWGFNTIAVSIDNIDIKEGLNNAFRLIDAHSMVNRLTIVLTDYFKDISFDDILEYCYENKIKQLTLRKATTPLKIKETPDSMKTQTWIRNNTAYNYPKIFNKLEIHLTNDNLIRKLPWNASVYDIHGIAVTVIDYCIQSSNNSDDIRSLIYHQDGHLYTSWDKPSSILF